MRYLPERVWAWVPVLLLLPALVGNSAPQSRLASTGKAVASTGSWMRLLDAEKSGDDVTGDDVTGDDVTGDDVTGDDVTGDDEKMEASRRRWRALPPEDRRFYRRLHGVLAQLSPERRAALEQRLAKLGDDGKQRLRERLRQFRQRPDDERNRLRKRHSHLQRWERYLPQEERRELHRLGHRERKKGMQRRFRRLSQGFYRSLSASERLAYDQLPVPEKRRRLHEFLDRHHGHPRARHLHPTDGRPPNQRRPDQRRPDQRRPGMTPELRERLHAERVRLNSLRKQLGKAPVEIRRALLSDPDTVLDPRWQKLQRQIKKLSPHQHHRLQRSLAPHHRDGRWHPRRRKSPGSRQKPVNSHRRGSDKSR